jgi:hypothetical protein
VLAANDRFCCSKLAAEYRAKLETVAHRILEESNARLVILPTPAYPATKVPRPDPLQLQWELATLRG